MRVLLAGPTADVHHLAGSSNSAPPTTWPGPPSPPSTCPPPSGCSMRSGHFDAIDVLAAPGADKATVQHAIAADAPHGGGGRDRPDGGQRADQRRSTRPSRSSRPRCWSSPSSRCSSAASRSSTRSRSSSASAPASSPCSGSSGPVAGRCSAPCWSRPVILGTGGVPDRAGPRRVGRVGPRGAAQGLRHHPAVGIPGLRGPDRHRRPGRGRRGDRGVGHQPGPARPCGSRRWRPWSTTGRTRRSRPGDGSSSARSSPCSASPRWSSG